MKNLNLKQIIISKITLFVLFLLLLSSSYSFAQCNVHSNFKEIIEYLEKDSNNRYHVQITIINPGRNGGKSHRYTAYASGPSIGLNRNYCSKGLLLEGPNVFFSDRNLFDRKRVDRQYYQINVVNNSVEVTLQTWGNTKYTVRNLTKRGRLIYGFDDRGKMIVFDFMKTQRSTLE